jgi:heme-degrading monooxygenase HmoA
MYARLVMFKLGTGQDAFAEGMAAQFLKAMQDLAGFKQAIFIGDRSIGEYGVLSLWESKEAAEAAGAALAPGLQQALQGQVQSPPSIRVLEVFEPGTA